ncbi:hypothetical protein HHI36_021566 [Cryptolaemus montrouzieri]|uniref:F-box domain-containing protein n=1 Tax=Cryptolaemus montrouzieri TaxID=559131 RepID=A0ABD2MXH8_9CUCU
MDDGTVSLMDFSDCLLLNLLRYLDSSTLFILTKVNTRLCTLVHDSCLWRKIDARNGTSSIEKIEFCLSKANESTTMLCLKGVYASVPLMVHMKMDKFPNLTILALENQIIDQQLTITLNDFPKSLQELSFKNSCIPKSSHFFKRTSEQMENLKVLLLDGCSQINSSVVMSVSKYPNLEILSFYKCQIENSIPYFSIAAWHGFKTLKILDVRLSGLGNPFLKSMIRCTNIVSFYFQNMDTSYVLDYKNRLYEIETQGMKAPFTDFALINSVGTADNLVTDKGTSELKRMRARTGKTSLPDSFLYVDPYGPCTCGFVDSNKENDLKDSDSEQTKYVSRKPKEKSYDWRTEPLSNHLDRVESATDRFQVKEYPAKMNQDSVVNDSLKRKCSMYQSETLPYKKLKKIIEKKSVSRELPSRCRSPKVSTSSPMDFASGLDEATTTDLSSPRNAPASTSGTSRSELGSETCTVSNTQTVECLHNGEKSERCVPLKKRKRNEVEHEDETGEETSACSSRSDHERSGVSGCSKFVRKGGVENDTEEDDDRFSNDPGPSTSGFSGRKSNDDSTDDVNNEDKPSTSGGNSSSAEEGMKDTSNEDSQDSPQTPPRAGRRDVESSQNILLFRNPFHAINNNVLKICISGNRRNAGNQEVNVVYGQEMPIVLNAVRMIDFMLPPDQQRQNRVLNPEVEIININMQLDKIHKTALKRLSFRGYIKVTDVTLVSIEHLNLEILDLTYTRVTKEGIQAF